MCTGVQYDSRKVSSAAMRFPASKRDAAEKLYISAAHEKSGYGRDSPGDSHPHIHVLVSQSHSPCCMRSREPTLLSTCSPPIRLSGPQTISQYISGKTWCL